MADVKFLINGREDAFVPVLDRGLHYGDGVFETIAIHQNNTLCWESHYRRMKSGCDTLGMDCPSSSILLSEFDQLKNSEELAVLKIIITRGSGGRGYRPPASPVSSTRILGLYSWPEYPEKNYNEGIKAIICQTRIGHNPVLAGMKHLNRLEQVLARNEWDQPDIAEGLMLDIDGNVIEGTMTNLFIVRDNILITPELSLCGVNGVIRQHILEIAAAVGLSTKIMTINEDDLYTANELFLCNSLAGIWSVHTLHKKQYQTNEIARKLRHELTKQKIIAR